MRRAKQIFIIVLGVLFFCQNSFGQNSLQKIDWNKTPAFPISFSGISLVSPAANEYYHPFFRASAQDLNPRNRATMSVAKDMSVKNWAFFCRQELFIEKTLKIPIKVRMGSLAQANALEGK
ncbi:MAG: hypothetical protein ABI415_03030 [Flavitalea sp.]